MAKEHDVATETFKSLDDKIDHVILQSRRIFFADAVDSDTARDAIRKIWYLELTDPGKPILFVINSPGGSIDSGFAIWDTVKMITSPIHTLVAGLAASMGSVLSLCAAEGKRFATPNSRIMVHQPRLGGAITGQATDLFIQAEEIIKTKDQLVKLYMDKTKKSKKDIEKALDRDTWLCADEAKKFGLIDSVVTSFKDIK